MIALIRKNKNGTWITNAMFTEKQADDYLYMFFPEDEKRKEVLRNNYISINDDTVLMRRKP